MSDAPGRGGAHPPTGTITFLFTDIEGSTVLWERAPEAMRAALAHHDALLRRAIEEHGGYVFKTVGDAFCAAFAAAPAAASAALAAQAALRAAAWDGLPGQPATLRVRMALHSGLAEERDGDYFGPALNRVARLLATGHGGQTLASRSAVELLRDHLPAGAALRELGEYRLKDLSRPEQVFQLDGPGLPTAFPPLRAAGARPGNLAPPREPPIGRAAEAAALRALILRPEVGLVTLTGPGGVGKTTLALHVAGALRDEFPGGVFFVDLAPLGEWEMVLPAVAAALELREHGGAPLAGALIGFLAARRALLLLDNFEQVLAAAPQVAALLAGAPGLKLLVTSRAVLRLRGEREFPVHPLPLPHTDDRPLLDALEQNPAVQLFVQRAGEVRPAFALTSENATAVAEIISRLDGLPLALELAAARLRVLSPHAMLSHLDSRLRLLTAGARDLPARQQTLRAAIAWSYSLLDAGEQALFRRLGVFVRGAPLDAIGAVCTGWGPALGLDALDGVQSLADKSLLRRPEEALGLEGEPRVSMLETIREFALEQLAQSGELGEARRRHAHYYYDASHTGAIPLFRRDQAAVWARMDQEHDNLRAALRWFVEMGDVDGELALAAVLGLYWSQRGHLSDTVELVEAALRRYGDGPPTWAYGRALLSAAGLHFYRSDLARSAVFYARSLPVNLAVGDDWGAVLAQANLAMVEQFRGSGEHAVDWATQALARAHRLGDQGLISLTQGDLGRVLFRQGDPAAAQKAFEASAAAARAAGDIWGLAEANNSLGDVARSLGDYARAAAFYEEAIAYFIEMGIVADVAAARHNLAYARLRLGDAAEAERLFLAALDQQQGIGNDAGVAECLAGLAAVRVEQGRPLVAAHLIGAVAALRAAIGEVIPWPAEQLENDRTLAQIRSALPPQEFAAAEAAGRALTKVEALRLARAQPGAALPGPP